MALYKFRIVIIISSSSICVATCYRAKKCDVGRITAIDKIVINPQNIETWDQINFGIDLRL